MDTAESISNTNRNTYGVAIYTFDIALNNSPTTGNSSPIFAPSGKPGVVQTPLTPSSTTSYTVATIQAAAKSNQRHFGPDSLSKQLADIIEQQ